MYVSNEGGICSYYKSRRTNVYIICMLDASKAFEREHFGQLFNLLRERELSAVGLRFLLDIHQTTDADKLERCKIGLFSHCKWS